MSTAANMKKERINLRLKGTVKNLLERAAGFEGKTVSNFIINCAMERAEETVRKHEIMSLTTMDSETFFNALSGNVQFNNKLTDAFDEHSQRIISK